jgi:hypothetical protein
VDAAKKGRSALLIIAELGPQLQDARLRRSLAMRGFQDALLPPFDYDDDLVRLSCLIELHQGMKTLYGLWWEGIDRILMGEPKGGRSPCDHTQDGLLVPQPRRLKKLSRSLIAMYRSVVGLLFEACFGDSD